jgi:hypothetical protein
MPNLNEWLTAQHERQALDYRIALEREIAATYRIFGVLNNEVKELLIKSLQEIPVPGYELYNGPESQEERRAAFVSAQKPDFGRILKEKIDEL